MRLVFAAAARRDIGEAFAFIAEDDPVAAEKQIGRVEQAAWRLTEFPLLGEARADGRRRFQVRGTPFRLVYRQTRDDIVILRVWHGARQWSPASR